MLMVSPHDILLFCFFEQVYILLLRTLAKGKRSITFPYCRASMIRTLDLDSTIGNSLLDFLGFLGQNEIKCFILF
jgi:RNase P/RNase MRP subunit POP5